MIAARKERRKEFQEIKKNLNKLTALNSSKHGKNSSFFRRKTKLIT
jgi:hypothetical protein